MRAVLSCSPKMHLKLWRMSSAGIARLRLREERVESPHFKHRAAKLVAKQGSEDGGKTSTTMGKLPAFKSNQSTTKSSAYAAAEMAHFGVTARNRWFIYENPFIQNTVCSKHKLLIFFNSGGFSAHKCRFISLFTAISLPFTPLPHKSAPSDGSSCISV